MAHHRFSFCLILLMAALLLAACASRTINPSVTPAAPTTSPVNSLPSATATPFPTPASTPTVVQPTLTAKPTEAQASSTPDFQLPKFDYANPEQLQILAQWSTGAVESRYHWSRDGSMLLLVSKPVARVIDLRTFQQLSEVPGGKDGDFSVDGSRVRILDGSTTRIYRTADGQPDTSGKSFSTAAVTEMLQPVKSFGNLAGSRPDRHFYFGSTAVQEDGKHRELRFFDADSGCASRIYTDLPAGITGYSYSPDNRLLLITAKGTGAEPDYQAVVLGINSGFEAPLPAHLQDPAQPGFHPTRPSIGYPQRLPILYTPLNGQYDYPPPIGGPNGPLESYRLKLWNEQAGLGMLRPLVEYATANDVYGPASGRGSLSMAQIPIRMAALEYLLRFPTSPDRNAIQWRLAMANTIDLPSSHETDGWIASQLEKALNQQGLPLEPLSLNAALVPFGFYVDTSPFKPGKSPYNYMDTPCDSRALPQERVLAQNLFGDGRQSQILIIKTIGSKIGLVMAVHQDSRGQYHVVPVGGAWALEVGMVQEIDVVDVTGDGKPEIRIDGYYHSGSMSSGTAAFYQWQGKDITSGKFAEITGGIYSDTEFQPLELEITGGPGAPKILIAHQTGILTYDAVEILKWNGHRFVSSARIPFPLDSNYADQPDPYLYALGNQQYEEIITQIRSMPPDPWRTFLQGYVEALQFHPGNARAELQPLADQAKTDPGNKFAQAAQAFLSVYQNGTDLYRACEAAQNASQEVYFCDSIDTIEILLERLSNQPAGDLPKTLESFGIKFFFQTRLDVNGDGLQDWLLVERLSDSDDYVWAVLSKSNGFEFVPFDFYRISEASSLELTPFQLPGADGKPIPAFLIKGGEDALLFRLRQEKGKWIFEQLLKSYGMSGYEASEEGGVPQLLIFHNTDSFDPPEIARWNPATETFEVSDYLEHLLLVEGRAGEALKILPDLLERARAWKSQDGYSSIYVPRLEYLLGLAYELSGDQENALRTYYDLWKSHPMPAPDYGGHPDQPYAIMVREKLERTK